MEGEAVLEVFDGEGRRVRRLSSIPEPQIYPQDDPDEPMKEPEAVLSTAAGLHRAVWDLRWEGARRLEKAKVDLGDPTVGPLATPGTFHLRLTAGGQTEETVLNVLPDPRSQVSAADLEAQLAFALDLRGRIDRVVADIGELRAIQTQADDLANRLRSDGRAAGLVAAAKRVTATASALELVCRQLDVLGELTAPTTIFVMSMPLSSASKSLLPTMASQSVAPAA